MSNPVFFTGDPVEGVPGAALLYHSRSVITRHREGLYNEVNRVPEKGITEINVSVARLYLHAFGFARGELLPLNRLLMEVKEPLRYLLHFESVRATRSGEMQAWIRDNTYCYELVAAPCTTEEKFGIMKQDLNRCFGSLLGITADIERRVVNCFALKRTDEQIALNSAGGERKKKENAFYFRLQNMRLEELVASLNMFYMQHSPLPLVDGTGYHHPVDMEIEAPMSDMDALNGALARYGLRFEEEDREMEMVVIKEKEKA